MEEERVPEHRTRIVEHVAKAVVDTAVHRSDQPLFPNELVVEQRVQSLRQDLIQQAEGIPLWGVAVRQVIAETECGPVGQRIYPPPTPFVRLARLAQVGRRW